MRRAILFHSASLLQTDNLIILAWDGHRKGKILIDMTAFSGSLSKEEILSESILCTEVQSSWLEVRVKRFLRVFVATLKLVKVVLILTEGWQRLTFCHKLCFPVFYWVIEKSVTHKIDKSVLIHAWGVIGKHLWVFLDEADDIIILLCWRLKTALTIGCNNEVVASDASAVTVKTQIRRIAQAITPVERVACIYQYVLNAETLCEVVVSKFCHKSIVPMFMCLLSAVTKSYAMFSCV